MLLKRYFGDQKAEFKLYLRESPLLKPAVSSLKLKVLVPRRVDYDMLIL